MPEPGKDGDELWPTFDDDERPRRSTGAPDERTHQLPQPPRLPPPGPPPPRRPPNPQPAAEPQTRYLPAPATANTPWPPPEPPRAAPTRIGPQPPQPPQPRPTAEPPPRRRRRRTALVVAAALVLVVGLAAAMVFAVPGLAGKLGLSDDEPAVAIRPPAPPIEFAPALRAPDGKAPAPTAAGVQAALAGPAASPALGSLTGTVLDPATGEVLWEKGAATPLVPASTGKLLTAAAALLSLDHTEQLTTRVVAGEQPGSVIIVGGGDPTLSSLKVGTESVYPGAGHLADLVAQVKANAPGQVSTVFVDIGRYSGDTLAPGWDERDIAGGYITRIVPAMLDGGRGDAAKRDTPRSPNPARALAEEFATRLGASVGGQATVTAPQGAKVLGEVRSAPIIELVDNLLQISDNVLAETIAREVARAAGEEPSFAGASKATLEVLRRNGFDTAGVELADASGLSTQNRVTAKLLASILSVAANPDGKDPRTAKLRPLLGGLPVAGGSGTLATRYQNPGATLGKGWVRAKTGTLSEVNSLAGVVLDADGRLLVFAMMTSGSQASAARPALDVVAATLRQCGCVG